MAEQTLESRTLIDTVDTSHLSVPALSALPETALKQALMEVINVTQGPPVRDGGFENKLSG